MLNVQDAMSLFRRQPMSVDGHENNPFRLRSTLSEPASAGEIAAAWNGAELPPEVASLWTVCRAARLFEDIDYGQWGLVILDPVSSAERTRQEQEERSREVRHDDVVLGTFLGDQELLLLAPSEQGNRRVMIALPLDERADWLAAASSLSEFLEAYFAAKGEKFWERSTRH